MSYFTRQNFLILFLIDQHFSFEFGVIFFFTACLMHNFFDTRGIRYWFSYKQLFFINFNHEFKVNNPAEGNLSFVEAVFVPFIYHS